MVIKKINFEKEKLKIKNEIEQLTSEIYIILTRFLIEKKCGVTKDIAKLWGVDNNTAKRYIKKAKNITYDDKQLDSDIDKIKNKNKVSWIEAVRLYYDELMRPKCGYGR